MSTSARKEARWKARCQQESDERGKLIREIEAAHMLRPPRPAAPAPALPRHTKNRVTRWLRVNAADFEAATALVEAATAEFDLPCAWLDDEAHWIWDEACEAVLSGGAA